VDGQLKGKVINFKFVPTPTLGHLNALALSPGHLSPIHQLTINLFPKIAHPHRIVRIDYVIFFSGIVEALSTS
jgi:hypothetical protein